MKKAWIMAVVFLLILPIGMTGCGKGKGTSEFTAVVLENNGLSLLVEPDVNSWVRDSADKISVGIAGAKITGYDGGKIAADDISAGAKVKITFTGGIAESYPAQIHGCTAVQRLDAEADYQTITAEQARDMMAQTQAYILLDVRTEDEFAEGHILGAKLIPDTEIASRANAELPDKNALILIYCRSGRRSALSAQTLADMGYTRVYDFGGIIDWPYETVTEGN